MSEEHQTAGADIEKVVVGELRPYAERVVVEDYDPRWPESFATQRDLITAALGGVAVLLEHAGSTSVPGLPAKPVIDILLAVPDSADEPAYLPALETLGYRLRVREPDWFEHRCLRQRTDEGDRFSTNLHVFTVGCGEIDRMLLFRDWLRAHPEDREHYAATKRTLARRRWRYVQDYADAKTPVVDEIVARARSGSDRGSA